ncbi:MAG: transglutaminase family protein [Leptotrichiaceae bacterium]|jgi:transglutaminase-like putative cysteine protease|nr:transglutaminase family protein [Leptotrichiaceae bacterium]MBP6168217.1 transglutaminase family protein [Leptotrichiaceae bacterium]MBP8636517.1 transglutaminase family protein [Leptotrichiaceae bacterium]MBP9538194.1 transglutaminase family protein [Leptotrichiaceae bacterium]MBP9875376.1 transglutaminase family protein [Leptotrichiaceae bacterium]
MDFKIKYETKILFSGNIIDHYFNLKFIPHDTAFQKVKNLEYSVTPNDFISIDVDIFKNIVIYGKQKSVHNEFRFEFSAIIEQDDEYYEKGDVGEGVSPSLFLYLHNSTVFSNDVKELSEKIKGEYDPSLSMIDKIRYYANYIFENFQYESNLTDTRTDVSQFLKLGRGVCQDFSNLLIVLLRIEDIPARYVSGFLEGIGETHAWVEFYDGEKWLGVDPTHNLLIDNGYIKIGHGLDSSNCIVNSGFFKSKEKDEMIFQTLEINVMVEKTERN